MEYSRRGATAWEQVGGLIVGAHIRPPSKPGASSMVLQAKDIMHADVLYLDGSTTVAEAARVMAQRRVGYALVREGSEPAGVVTEWDFLSKIVGERRDPATTLLRAIATTPLITAEASTPTEQIVEMMDRRGIRRMILIEQGRIVGVVSSKEVLHSFRQYVDRVSTDISRMHPAPP